MNNQEIIDNAPEWADTHRKLLDYPDCTTYVDNKYEDKLDRSLADIKASVAKDKRIAELEEAIDNVLISSTDMGSYFEVGIMPIFDLQELRSEFKGGAE
jgi:hypothetical protein